MLDYYKKYINIFFITKLQIYLTLFIFIRTMNRKKGHQQVCLGSPNKNKYIFPKMGRNVKSLWNFCPRCAVFN